MDKYDEKFEKDIEKSKKTFNIRESKLIFVASIILLIAGFINVVLGKYIPGLIFIIIGGLYLGISSAFKKNKV
ncbi:hypothetical protein M4I33_06730 [Clostridium sp. LY3-2]|uniref:hypothetical protein n=1 Tax=Clostridium sp. LY3-2 TaxID=2942482 RepID=UPI0021537E46|nr:hypothetical protein [Clostridium sp. LY3-2]MCR6514571.1 hypothetical protein [Clostridium sp. LY3-2]